MELQTISHVSREYGISPRMLRYYEQSGLIESKRKADYAYRVYDEKAITRLRQIIVLRKLRVPVKQIVSILNNSDAAEAVEIFRLNIGRIDSEITALSTIKSILEDFIEEINKKTDISLKLLGGDALFSVINTLSFSDNQIKETKESLTMEDLKKANEELMKLEDKDVRIVYLPPMTVAAAYFSGKAEYGVGPEATGMIERFVWESGLLNIKPDARGIGFPYFGETQKVKVGVTPTAYEAWVSIPDDMEVKAPLVKKAFDGGMYAAHVLRDWGFQDWSLLSEWVKSSGKYEEIDEPHLEEVLNYVPYMQNGAKMEDCQMDLLLPIKEKKDNKHASS